MSTGAGADRVWIEVTTIGDLVDRQASRSDADAIVFPDSRTTFPELAELSDHFARGLMAAGIGPGDKVGILMPNGLDFVLALIGAAKLGAVSVPINGRFKAHELGHVVSHADVAVLLTAAGPPGTPDYPAMLGEVFPHLAAQDPHALALAQAPLLRRIVDCGAAADGAPRGMLARAEFEAGGAGVAVEDVRRLALRVRVRDVALLMYTSGTTARPKGCLITHEAVVRQGNYVAVTRFRMGPEDRFWDPLPMFHCGGLIPMLGCISVGARFVHAGHFDADVALRQLEEERITVAYPSFETIWFGILDHPRFAQTDLSSIRLIQNIAVPERLAQFEARMPWAAQVTSYGSTESATNLTLPFPDDPFEVRIGTLGHPMEGMEVRICDPETGAERAVGEVGELCFRGYSRFEGYYKDPELTAAAIDADGFFHSGDLASVDEHGRLRYAGRLKDMLKVGGENVAAIEIEAYLVTHPAVNIAQVVGADDARYGEVPAAFIELAPDPQLSESELVEFCVGRIATFKVPRYVRFVTEWPMSGTKIQKFRLREQLAAELQALGITEAPRIDSSRVAAPNATT
jgi:fatty-acyl-CoA synthase